MERFKIITLSVLGRGKKIYECGQVVNKDQLIESELPRLIKGKYIEQVESEATITGPVNPDESESGLEFIPKPEGGEDETGSDEKTEPTKEEIMEALKNAGIPFDSKSKKAVLLEMANKLNLV